MHMTTLPPDHIARPEFGISVRGYDRAQVDAYFGRVVEWLAEAENRAILAERVRESLAREVTDLRTSITMLEQRSGLPAPQSLSAFSERMGQVMESALQASQELRSEAEREAQECRDAAESEAERTIAAAREESEKIVDVARRAQRAMEESIGDLHAARAEVVETLLELQCRIAAVVGVQEPSTTPGDIGRDDVDADEVDAEEGAQGDVDESTVASADDPGEGEAGTSAGPDSRSDADPATDTGVLVTAAPTIVQPTVGRGAGGNGTARGRRRSA
jgi:cell division septum initiation protein DivIVA